MRRIEKILELVVQHSQRQVQIFSDWQLFSETIFHNLVLHSTKLRFMEIRWNLKI